MRYALVGTATDRPEVLDASLSAWDRARGLLGPAGWFPSLLVEPTAAREAVLDVVERHQGWDAVMNPKVHGVLSNPWHAFEHGFWTLRAAFVVLAEDDVAVSSDVLEYMAWAAHEFAYDRDVLAVCAYGGPGDGDLRLVRRGDSFSPHVWGTWVDRWEEHLRDTWDHDYSTFNGRPGHQAGFDWNIHTRLMPARGLQVVVPDVSRAQHIGRTGVHMTPDAFAASQVRDFRPDIPPQRYGWA